jgi:hypothetical protein
VDAFDIHSQVLQGTLRAKAAEARKIPFKGLYADAAIILKPAWFH